MAAHWHWFRRVGAWACADGSGILRVYRCRCGEWEILIDHPW